MPLWGARFRTRSGFQEAYPSSFCQVSSTGRAFWGLPVELLPGFLYESGFETGYLGR